MREAYRAGAVDYLVKPFREKRLLARISVHFNLPLGGPATPRTLLAAVPSFFEVSASHESRIVMETIAVLQTGGLVWPGTVQLACQLGITEVDLEQAFGQQFGLTVEAFHWLQRLEWARMQLRSTPQTTAGIAQALGCPDVRNFAHQFRQHYGLLPEDYRGLH
jgi:transcriptional regulator GlxA family with amidase domain